MDGGGDTESLGGYYDYSSDDDDDTIQSDDENMKTSLQNLDVNWLLNLSLGFTGNLI